MDLRLKTLSTSQVHSREETWWDSVDSSAAILKRKWILLHLKTLLF